MTIRVLHLIHDLGSGGAEKQLVMLAERLAAHGVEAECATILDRGVHRDRVRSAGIPLHTLGARPSVADFPLAAARLRALLLERRPDILQTWLFYADLLGRLVAPLAGSPAVIGSMRNVDDWRRPVHVLADRLTAPLADVVVANSLAGAARLLAVERLAAARLRVIHNGIDAAATRAAAAIWDARLRFGIPADAPLVAAAGRLHPQKDFPVLLSAFARLRARFPAARLVVAGEGAERPALERLAADLGLAGAALLPGELPGVAPLLSAADAVALSSRYEGLPNVLLEAGALGRPVAATAVGGVPELVRDGEGGLLAPPSDPEALARAIGRLLADRDLADRLGASLRDRVERRFTPDAVARRHAELYRELLEERERRRGAAPAPRWGRRPQTPTTSSPLSSSAHAEEESGEMGMGIRGSVTPGGGPGAAPAAFRLLLVVTRTDVGGAQKHVLELAAGLAARGVAVEVAGGRGGDLLARVAAAGIPIHEIPTLDRDIAPLDDLRALAALVRLIRRVKPDLVHAHSTKAGLLARLAAAAAGVPAVYTAHGFAFHGPSGAARRALYLGLERLGGALADGLIAVSRRDLAAAEREGIGAAGVRAAVPNGIDPEALPPRLAPRERLRASLGIADGEFLVGAFGRHCHEKAYDTLVAAAARLAADPRCGSLRFVIMGGGVARHRAGVERLAREAGLGRRLLFAGEAPPEALPYAAFDLYALPSRKEGLPYTLLEAGALGLPLVATDVGGVGEVVEDGVTGRLVPPDDPAAFAAAVAELALAPEARRRALGAAAAARVRERFTLERMVDSTMHVYEEVLRRRGRTTP